MTTTAVALDNPLWAEVEQHVTPGKHRYDPARQIEWYGLNGISLRRMDHCSTYSWTITAPDTVAFVAEHLGRAVIDPMAGSGYWAYLLGQLGKDVVATDLAPAGEGSANPYHKNGSWLTVDQFDGVRSVGRLGVGRSLLLSWPPYDEPVGANILAAFTGDRLVYIGELSGGCCGDDDLFAALERDWDMVAEHAPVQWFGMHDYVQAYTRKAVQS